MAVRDRRSPKGAYFTLGSCDSVLIGCSIVLLIIALALILSAYVLQLENRTLLRSILELIDQNNQTVSMLADVSYRQHYTQMNALQAQHEAFKRNLQ